MSSLEKYQKIMPNKRKTINGKIRYNRVQSSELHAHYPNITDSPPTVIKNAKDQILRDFAFGFKKYNQQISSITDNMSFEQLQQILNIWNSDSSENVLAQTLSDTIAQKLQSESWTGAGIEKGFNKAFYTDEETLTNTQVLDQTNYIWKQVEDRLKRYIRLYHSIGEEALLDKCLSLYIRTGHANQAFLTKYNNRRITPKTRVSINKKVDNVFRELEINLQEIFNLMSAAQGGTGEAEFSGFNSQKGIELTPAVLAKKLGGSFNTLGGEQIGEIVGVWAAKQVKLKGNKEVLTQIENMFKTSGGKIIVSSRQTGQDTIKVGKNTIQQKGDWEIILTDGKVELRIPVSQKLYQSSSSKNVLALPGNEQFAGKITAQSLSLQQLLAMCLEGSPAWFEQHMSVLSSTQDDHIDITATHAVLNDANRLWNDFRQAAKYIGLFRALVGTGAQTKNSMDFASLLIVNSQIFSVADILQQAVKTPDKIFSMGRQGNEIQTFPQIRERVSGQFYSNPKYDNIREIGDGPKDRVPEQYKEIKALYGEKYRFEINIGMLTSILT